MSTYQPFPSFEHWRTMANGHEAFDRYAEQFRALGDDVRGAPVDKLKREAAVDTNAVEGIYSTDRGFTRTVAEQSFGWESAMTEKGDHVRPAFDDVLASFDYVLDVATARRPLTEALIRELHQAVAASQSDHEVLTVAGPQRQALAHGQYKTMPNSPTRPDGTIHAYASVDDTPLEMARLVKECSTSEFDRAHPVEQASYIHFAFVCVHPFADGNGRVSRQLASIYLLRDPGIPLVLFADQRTGYLDALEAADAGNARPFIDFIEQRAIDSMMTVLESAVPHKGAGTTLAELDAQERSRTPDELAGPALRLADAVFTELESQVSSLPQQPLTSQCFRGFIGEAPRPAAGYDLVGEESTTWNVSFQSQFPSIIQIVNCAVTASTAPAAGYPTFIVIGTSAIRPMEIFLRDVEPTLSASLITRISRWCEVLLAELAERATAEYRQKR
ncbi:Fic family protein [Corynebacterium doosanense]|uniref:Fido domain-containing protein n=1 Tax=Corynebacterium doosanense CAU 212 = DSM 45436 TaxID=558173 RepID=A0A097IF24_9CORY|nr:Fic family protein [Corynebacterium doosanense]AIT60724.1 hypothetical protein CDOO_05250 [Corynebacterium doosanense CAU 212 = DSM 45436]